MLEMAGLPLKPKQHLDGVSIRPLLTGKNQLTPRPIFWHYPHYGNQGGSPGSAVRLGDYKLIQFYEDNRIELYNIMMDIGETQNLEEKLPDKKRELLLLLQQWQGEVGARMPSKNPDYRDKSSN